MLNWNPGGIGGAKHLPLGGGGGVWIFSGTAQYKVNLQTIPSLQTGQHNYG